MCIRDRFIPGDTLFFFDELQACPNCATSLKFFKLDGRFDVICSGSLMGINYKEIESNSVGYKEDYEMFSMDFEEFLWANGYKEDFIEDLYMHMHEVRPLSTLQVETLFAPPFDHKAFISGQNLFVLAYHGFATLGNEHQPSPVPFESFPPFAAFLGDAVKMNGSLATSTE